MRPLPLLAGLALAGCGHALPEITGFQAAAWRADRYACAGQRAALLPPAGCPPPALPGPRQRRNRPAGPPRRGRATGPNRKNIPLLPGARRAVRPRHPRAATPQLSIHFGPLGTVTEVQADPLGDTQ
ncbi:MAG: hypothetical protein WKG07_50220 [Hymenobacter sp.]